jgi:hypothetical protein
MLEGSGTASMLEPPTATEGVGLAEPTPAKAWAYRGLGEATGRGVLSVHPFVCFDLVLNRLS